MPTNTNKNVMGKFERDHFQNSRDAEVFHACPHGKETLA